MGQPQEAAVVISKVEIRPLHNPGHDTYPPPPSGELPGSPARASQSSHPWYPLTGQGAIPFSPGRGRHGWPAAESQPTCPAAGPQPWPPLRAFKHLEDHEMQLVVADMSECRFKSGEVIAQEGVAADGAVPQHQGRAEAGATHR